MRSVVRSCLCFTFLVVPVCVSAQQETTESAPKSAATSPLATNSDTSSVDRLAAHATRTLPAHVNPNPPNAGDLKMQEETWKGEYEADANGSAILGLDAKPIPVLYNRKGKRIHSKYKAPKTHPINIVNGTLTVDGWTGKARLNHDIPDLKYIYLSAPGMGTVIIAQTAFPGSEEQKQAFAGTTLTVKAGNHELQLSSDQQLVQSKQPVSAYVKFDPAYLEDPKYPVMGYGTLPISPYEWPGAKQATVKGAVESAPPLPASMRPRMSGAVAATPAVHPINMQP